MQLRVSRLAKGEKFLAWMGFDTGAFTLLILCLLSSWTEMSMGLESLLLGVATFHLESTVNRPDSSDPRELRVRLALGSTLLQYMFQTLNILLD